MEAQIPTAFYTLVGTLVLSQFGVLGALIVFIFKSGMFVADTKSGIKNAKDTAVRAHLRIDNIQNKTEGYNESTV